MKGIGWGVCTRCFCQIIILFSNSMFFVLVGIGFGESVLFRVLGVECFGSSTALLPTPSSSQTRKPKPQTPTNSSPNHHENILLQPLRERDSSCFRHHNTIWHLITPYLYKPMAFIVTYCYGSNPFSPISDSDIGHFGGGGLVEKELRSFYLSFKLS